MSKQKEILAHNVTEKSLQEAAEMLRQMADSIEAGKLSIPQAQTTVTLELPEKVEFELELKQKTSKDGSIRKKLEVELKWTE